MRFPICCEREGTNNENLPETHDVLKTIRARLDANYKGKLFLAEANQWPEDVREYFGDGDECHMAYHFPLMPRMYMAIAQEDRHPIVEIMRQTPEIPANCQWAIFLRNHDELTLEMVTSRERDYMYRMYAADPRARINLGIRRRLAPLMENDPARIKLMNSLLLSMPGSPIIYYGDEIGMGDNIFLGDRNGVRTPMQWSPDRNAGFSRADPQRLYLPPIMDPVYGYEAVNVEAQPRAPSSLLNWMRRMLAVRKTSQAFGRGKLTFLAPGNRKVLAYLREFEDETILCVANLARSAQPVELDLRRFKGLVPVEMIGRTAFPPIGELPYLLTLPAHGFYWFRLSADVEVPSWHEEWLPPEDLPVVVLFDGWTSFFRERVVPWRIRMAEKTREQLEVEVLPHFLAAQRWYAAKSETTERATLVDHVQWKLDGSGWLLTMVDAIAGGVATRYFVPLALVWGDSDDAAVRALGPAAMAKVRQQADLGLLADAIADESFCRALVQAIGRGGELKTAHGAIRFSPTEAYGEIAGDDLASLEVRRGPGQSSNAVVSLGNRLFLKAYRRLGEGVNPEFEVGRFLTTVANFEYCVPVAGALEYISGDGTPTTLALLQAYVPNQGDGWAFSIDYLQRFIEERTALAGEAVPPDVHGAYLDLAQTLGTRVAQLHLALAMPTDDSAFGAQAMEPGELPELVASVRRAATQALDFLQERAGKLPEDTQAAVAALLASRERLIERIERCTRLEGTLLKSRLHGDLHLGQVLLAHNDFLIIDFEGEPERPIEERRRKQTPAARRRRHAAFVQLRTLWRLARCGRARARVGRDDKPGGGLGIVGARQLPRRLLAGGGRQRAVSVAGAGKGADRALRDREGAVRTALRNQQSPGLGRHPVAGDSRHAGD